MKFYLFALSGYALLSTLILILLMLQNRELKMALASLSGMPDINFSEIHSVSTHDSPSFGPKNAPFTLVVFSDFHCPGCKDVSIFLDELVTERPGDLRVVYKLVPMGQEHWMRSRAAYAAHRQGKFWDFKTYLFQNAQEWDTARISAEAATFNMDQALFEADIQSENCEQAIHQHQNEADQFEVNFLPTIFINGIKIEGPNESRIRDALEKLEKVTPQ